MDFVFETERCFARRFTQQDAKHIFDLDSDPEVHRYLGNNPITNLTQAEAIIDRTLGQYEENGFGRLALILKETGEFIGWSGIKLEKAFLDNPYYDMGYRLMPTYWSKGYATEAAIGSLDYGFRIEKLDKIYGAANVENKASDHILRVKLGMKYEFSKIIFDMDHRFYALSRSEWVNR